MSLIMQKGLRLLTAGFMMLLLLSCTVTHQGLVRYHQLAACKASCKERLVACTRVCSDNCMRCTISANARAARNFLRYKHQQCVQGKIVALELQSFRDPLQCRKSSCACPIDYQVCTQSCHGTIYKRLQVVPPCAD